MISLILNEQKLLLRRICLGFFILFLGAVGIPIEAHSSDTSYESSLPSDGMMDKYIKQCRRLGISEADCGAEIRRFASSKPTPSKPEQSITDAGSKKHPEETNENAPTDEAAKPPATVHEQQGLVAQKAAEEEARRQAQFDRDAKEANRVAQSRMREAEALAKKKAEESRLAQERAAAEHDRKLVEQLKARLKKEEEISLALAEQAKNKEVREKLMAASIVKNAGNELEREREKAGLNLAKLLEMAAVTMQAATAMTSLNQATPVQSSSSSASTKDQPGLSGRSPASLGDKADISEKSVDAEEESANGAKNAKTKEQIKQAIEDAAKRKKILALRKAFREKLKDKMAKGEKLDSVDTEALFGGSLTAKLAEEEAAAGSSESAESAPAKDGALAGSSVFQAMKDGFSLAGAETDHEVNQIVAEAERDLSSLEMNSGVLGVESRSLFERVHSAHQACARQKCVILNSQK